MYILIWMDVLVGYIFCVHMCLWVKFQINLSEKSPKGDKYICTYILADMLFIFATYKRLLWIPVELFPLWIISSHSVGDTLSWNKVTKEIFTITFIFVVEGALFRSHELFCSFYFFSRDIPLKFSVLVWHRELHKN